VVLVGDLNSQPDDTGGAYGTLAAAGYVDAWVVVHGPAGGFTAGQTELLDSLPPSRTTVSTMCCTGREGSRPWRLRCSVRSWMTALPTGLWPSDYAGVVATLQQAHP
jgi:hypothetical protein